MAMSDDRPQRGLTSSWAVDFFCFVLPFSLQQANDGSQSVIDVSWSIYKPLSTQRTDEKLRKADIVICKRITDLILQQPSGAGEEATGELNLQQACSKAGSLVAVMRL